MSHAAESWFERFTTGGESWPMARVLEARRRAAHTVAVVIPAHNEEATVGSIVREVLGDLVESAPLVDEVIVMDSDSEDRTADVARAAGAKVFHTSEVAPGYGSFAGKGEAMWKSLFVTDADILVFMDADLTVWSPRFVVAMLGPILSAPSIRLVKGFYRRLPVDGGADGGGGRVTELVARPLLNLWWPSLARVVQPLAGEWAVRRSLLETLPIPVGYGVELSVLVDTFERHGLDAMAQVDLGVRDHRHQPLRDLGMMAAELLGVAHRRRRVPVPADPVIWQYDAAAGWQDRMVSAAERPPAVSIPAYASGH